MLTRLIQLALNNRGWVALATLVTIASGVFALVDLPIDAVPDITNVQVVINSKTQGLDPEKIEAMVTRPIETEMMGIPKLEEIRSISKYGLSQVTLVFQDQTDIYWARQLVSERLAHAKKDIPESVSPELAPITTGLGEVFMYAVEAEPTSSLAKKSLEERLSQLRIVQDYVIRPHLKRITGVADVDSNGGYQKEIHINFFPDRLEKYGITAEQLVQRLETLGENFGGGYIQSAQGEQIIVRTVPGISQIKQLEAIPIGRTVQGKPIRLAEVARVAEEHALRVGAATRNGEETVLGTILMQVGANSREVAQEAEKAIQEITLPPGVKIIPLYSRSYLVNATIYTVTKNLVEGAALVVLVLFLLLGNIRAAIIVACAIPLSMLVAFRGMILSGISANLMSLGAIDFGLLVDGSVVLVENILRRRSVLEGAAEVIQPVVFGLFLIMLVYVPILSLEGVEGKMFQPMAITVLLALAASLLVAVFLMPVLADFFLKPMLNKKQGARLSDDHDTWFFSKCREFYLPALHFSFDHHRLLLGITSVLAGLAIVLSLNMGADFVPQLDEGDLVLGLIRSPKQGIDASVEDQKVAERIIQKAPEVEAVFSRLGTPETATDPMGVNFADTFILLKKDRSAWQSESKSELAKKLSKALLEGNPNQEISVTQPIEMRFNEILEGSRADVSLRIIGPELEPLMELIDQAKARLETVPGTESIEFDPLTALKKSPTLDLELNYDALSRYQISLSNLNALVELAMSGKTIGTFFENTLPFPIKIHLDESLRNRIESIQNIPVGLPEGGTIPLSTLTHFKLQEKVTTIARFWGNRYAAIAIDLKDRDVASFVSEAKTAVSESIKLPEGYSFYWGGQFKNLSRAKAKLFVILPFTLLIVFFILLKIFKNFRETVLIFSSVPLAAIGGVYALFFRGIPFSVSAAVGFIALIGIALLNGLVLMTVMNQTRKKRTLPPREIAEQGALSRLRPVLMTALVASLGFLPMALNTGIGAEVQRPLATVVIGGLITSTLLTLLLIPTLFLHFVGNKLD